MKKLAILALCLFLGGCASNDSSTSATSNRSPRSSSTAPTPLPIGDPEDRLAVAAGLRRYLREQNIAANVVVNGTKLMVSYKSASIEDAPDTFIKQQGDAGMGRIANAGFETLIISAQDSSGAIQTKEIPVAEYRTK